MTTDPERFDVASHAEATQPPDPAPQASFPPSPPEQVFAHEPRAVPHLGHTLIFGGIVVLAMLGVMFIVGLGSALHIFGSLPVEKIQKNPLIVIPTMAVAYFLIWAVSWFLFPLMWYRPFLDGVSWNLGVARRRWPWLLMTGLGVGLAVQFLSNFLPIPKTLPIDDFFKTRSSIWMISIFGIFIAPALEELAFRGFLLPSLATAWDWLGQQFAHQPERPLDPVSGQPSWSLLAMVVASIGTSIPFALLHAEQLAHAFAPLSVLFGVSIVLCVVRLATSSLAASVAVHAAYNFSIFALVFLATDGFRHLDKLRS
ncbi:MAG TPA: type II CAAX endopeptidase family protein [Acidisarcina sp.]|nr:type II CAAX endopeptidase family protein [Acidisarcina sp.]